MAKLIQCKHCGATIAKNAKVCPQCGGKNKKPLFLRGWFVVLVVLALLGGVGGKCASKSSDAQQTKTETKTSTTKPTITVLQKNTSKATEEPTPEPTQIPYYHIGDKVTFDDIEVTVNSITFSPYMGGSKKLKKADDGLINCVITIDVKNLTTSRLDLESNWPKSGKYVFSLVEDGENKYGQTYAKYTDFFSVNEAIPAKGTIKNKMLNFIVPIEMKSSATAIDLQLTYNSIWKPGIAIWSLR